VRTPAIPLAIALLLLTPGAAAIHVTARHAEPIPLAADDVPPVELPLPLPDSLPTVNDPVPVLVACPPAEPDTVDVVVCLVYSPLPPALDGEVAGANGAAALAYAEARHDAATAIALANGGVAATNSVKDAALSTANAAQVPADALVNVGLDVAFSIVVQGVLVATAVHDFAATTAGAAQDGAHQACVDSGGGSTCDLIPRYDVPPMPD